MSTILAATLLLTLQTTASSPTLAPMLAASPTNDPAALRAIKRGQLLYAYDQAAWHGTDEFLAHHRDLIPKRGGYIVDGPVEAPHLTFFDADTQRALYSANVVDGRVSDVVVPSGQSAKLSPLDHRSLSHAPRRRRRSRLIPLRTLALKSRSTPLWFHPKPLMGPSACIS